MKIFEDGTRRFRHREFADTFSLSSSRRRGPSPTVMVLDSRLRGKDKSFCGRSAEADPHLPHRFTAGAPRLKRRGRRGRTPATAYVVLLFLLLVSGYPQVMAQPTAELPRLSLIDAVRLTLDGYPTMGMAEAQADQARATVGEAKAAWFPSLSFAAVGTQYEEPMVATPIHGFTPGTLPAFDKTVTQYGLQTSFTLFDGGGRLSRVRQARSLYNAATATVEETRQAVTAQVIAAYLNVLGKQEVLNAHDFRVEALLSELSRVNLYYEHDRAAQVEILRAEAALANAQADRVRAAAALDVAESELALLVNTDEKKLSAARLLPVVLSDSIFASQDDLLTKGLAANPTVQQAMRKTAAARAGLSVARSERWPKLLLTGTWFDQGDLNGNRVNEWNAGVSLSLPLFTGGAVNRRISRARAAQRSAEEEQQLAKLQTEQQIDRTLAALAEAHARVTSLTKAVNSFTEVVRIEKLLVETGSGTQTDYLDAEADLVIARANLVEARHGEITAQVELARLTGELNMEWINQYLESQQ